MHTVYQPSRHQLKSTTNVQYAAMRWARFRVVIDGSITALYIFLAFQFGAWQLVTIAAVAVTSLINDVIGIGLIRRNRIDLGVSMIVIGLLPVLLINSMLIAGLGFLLALVSLLTVSPGVAQALSLRQLGRLVITTTLSSIAVLAVDLVKLPFDRLPVPEYLRTVILVAAGIMALAYGLVIARQFRNYTIRTKFVLTFLAVFLIPLGSLGFFYERRAQQTISDSANQSLSAAAMAIQFRVEDFVDSNLNSAQNHALLPDFIDLLSGKSDSSESRTRTILSSLRGQDLQHISSIGLLDRTGLNILDSADSQIDSMEGDQDYFQVPLASGEPYVSPILFIGKVVDQLRPASRAAEQAAFEEEGGGEPEIVFSAPIRNSGGQILGVLRLRYRAGVLQELIKDSNGLAGEGSFAVLFDENNLYLAHSNPDRAPQVNYKLTALPDDPTKLTELWVSKRIPKAPISELSADLAELTHNLNNADSNPFFEAMDVGDQRMNQVAVRTMSGHDTLPWRIGFFQPRENFLAAVEAQTQLTVFLSVVMAVLVTAAAVGVSQLLAGPITRLTAVAHRIADGALQDRAKVESGDETGMLAKAFNDMNDQLGHRINSLQDQVQERISELLLSKEVGRHAAAIRDLDQLLPTISDFIRERFNLYYVQVYLVDDVGQNLIIRAGTGAVGHSLLAQRHSFSVGGDSIIGQAAISARPIMVSDTEASKVYIFNPLLPKTRSELAVQLLVEGRVIGVLDMQSERIDRFNLNNSTVFEAMATQLAISIDSAQQWTLAQAAQHKSEQTLKQLTRASWADTLAKQHGAMEYTYDLFAIVKSEANADDAAPINGALSAPVLIQNEAIGHLVVETWPGKKVTSDDRALVEAVAQQLAQKAENLRLFEATQQHAAREQITREITDRMRAAADVDSIINTGLTELAKALGVPRAYVKLDTGTPAMRPK